MPEQWIAIVWCSDCNGVDSQGCFDGGVEKLGPFDIRDQADDAGRDLAKQGGIWLYEVKRA